MALCSTASCGYEARVISIELPEDQICRHSDRSGYCSCIVRTGGDCLEGEVSFHPALCSSSVIDVCFEGFSRTWVQKVGYAIPSVNETQFLQQVESIETRQGLADGENENIKWPEIRTVAFKFKIPDRLPAISNISCPDSRQQELCPSMTAGRLYQEGLNGKVYMQPWIFYRLSASARTKEKEPQRPRIGVARQITIMPTTICPPPTYTSVFQEEYKLEATSQVRKHFYGQSRGCFEIAAEEPQPMNVAGPGSRSSTVIVLKGRYKQGKSMSVSTSEPYKWTFRIRSRLQRRLFYATKALNQEPTVADAKRKSHIALHTEILQSEERECSELTWRNDHISSHGTIVSVPDKASTWSVMIPLVFTTKLSLVPSFFSTTVALRYSILLDVHIVGLRSSHASLEIPVQVVCHSHGFSKDSHALGDQLTFQLSSVHEVDRVEDYCDDGAVQPPKYRRWAY